MLPPTPQPECRNFQTDVTPRLSPAIPDCRVIRIKKLCRSRSGTILDRIDDMNSSPRTVKIKDLLDGFMYRRCLEWGNLFPEAVGTCQSPINLVSRDACYDPELEKNELKFNYCICRETDILNNGHTLAVFPRIKQESLRHESMGRSVISGGPLQPGTEYELAEIRFHWGRENNKGSEHTVNKKAFPMEVQLVHWNSEKYSSIEEALGSPSGIAIVSLFTQLGREHTGLRVVTDNLEDVLYKGRQKTATSAFNPTCLLPDPQLRDFWAYEGSLTSPPCSEKVTWILFRYPLMLSHSQLEEFRRLRTFPKGESPKTGEDGVMADNFRPTQKLGDRRVRASFQS